MTDADTANSSADAPECQPTNHFSPKNVMLPPGNSGCGHPPTPPTPVVAPAPTMLPSTHTQQVPSGCVQQPGLHYTQSQLGPTSRVRVTVKDVGSSTPPSPATGIVFDSDRATMHSDVANSQAQSALILKANRIEYLPESSPSDFFTSPAGCCAPGQPTRRQSSIHHGDDELDTESATEDLTKNYKCDKDKVEVVGCKKGRFPALRCGCEDCTNGTHDGPKNRAEKSTEQKPIPPANPPSTLWLCAYNRPYRKSRQYWRLVGSTTTCSCNERCQRRRRPATVLTAGDRNGLRR